MGKASPRGSVAVEEIEAWAAGMMFGLVWVEDHANKVVALEVARIASRIVSEKVGCAFWLW